MITCETLTRADYSLNKFIEASPMSEKVYDVLVDYSGNESLIRSLYRHAYWLCMVAYIYEHPELRIQEISQILKSKFTSEQIGCLGILTQYLLLEQPDLNKYQRKYLSLLGKFSSEAPTAFLEDVYEIERIRRGVEEIDPHPIEFMQLYYFDAYVFCRYQDHLEDCCFSPADVEPLIKLMHTFHGKVIMFELLEDIAMTRKFQIPLNYFYKICDGEFGMFFENVFHFPRLSYVRLEDTNMICGQAIVRRPTVRCGDIDIMYRQGLSNEHRYIEKVYKTMQDAPLDEVFSMPGVRWKTPQEETCGTDNDNKDKPVESEFTKKLRTCPEKVAELLKILHSEIDGQKGKAVARAIVAAISAKVLTEVTSTEVQNEFGDIGNVSGFNAQRKLFPDKNDTEYVRLFTLFSEFYVGNQ